LFAAASRKDMRSSFTFVCFKYLQLRGEVTMQSKESRSRGRGNWGTCLRRKMLGLSRSGAMLGVAMALVVLPPFVNTAYADCASERQTAYDACQATYVFEFNAAAGQYNNVDIPGCDTDRSTCNTVASLALAAALVGCSAICVLVPPCIVACMIAPTAIWDAALVGCLVVQAGCYDKALAKKNQAQQDALDKRNNVCYPAADGKYTDCING
jgi:hypothetical protein